MDTSAPTPSSVPPAAHQGAAQPIVVPPPRTSPWRWVLRVVGLVLLLAVGLVAAAPTIVSKNPELRDDLIRRFMGPLDGTITIKSLSIGWTTPLEIDGLALHPHSNSQPVPGSSANQEPLVKVDRVESERTLWEMLWNRSDVGTIRIERPDVFLALGEEKGESNFAKVFGPILKREAKTPSSLTFGVRAQIVDGKVRGFSEESREPWEVPGINIAAGVRSAELAKSGKPELFVEKGVLVSRAQLNPGVCNDVLKYIAPNLAATTRARGTFSIDLDEWRLPWKDFGSGELSGRLTMHTVDIGPGALTEQYLRAIEGLALVGDWVQQQKLNRFVSIADNTVVSFKLVEGGKIHHEGLKFSMAGWVDVQSHGDVGLDESLDLKTWFGIHPPNPEERKLAILRQLTTQEWPINIRGKMGAPQIDASPLNVAWKQLLLQKVPADWLSGRSSVGGNVIGKLNESGVLTPERTGALLGLLNQLATPQPGPAPHQVQRVDPSAMPNPVGPSLGAADGAGPMPATVEPNTATTPNPPSSRTVPPLPTPPLPTPPNVADPTATLPPPNAAPAATAEPPKFGVADGVKLGLDVLGAVRAHRQQQLQQQGRPGLLPQQPPAPMPQQPVGPPGAVLPNANGPTATGPFGLAPPDTNSNMPPPRRPLLRQGLRMLLDTATQPPPPTAQPSGTQPSASQPPTAQPPISQPPAAEPPGPAKREP